MGLVSRRGDLWEALATALEPQSRGGERREFRGNGEICTPGFNSPVTAKDEHLPLDKGCTEYCKSHAI
jgi:hypothetical protein